MSDWLQRFADALGEEPLPPEEVSAILDLTRDVAHNTQRKLAPITSYLIGIQVGRQLAGGADRDDAFDEAVDRILTELPGPDAGHEPSTDVGHPDAPSPT